MSYDGPDMMASAKRKLQDNIASVCVALGLLNPPNKRVWQPPNPMAGGHQGAFTVWLKGPSAGSFKVYNGSDKGDVIDLVAYLKRCTRKEALAWAMDRYGLKAMTDEERKRLDERSRRERAAAEQRAREDMAKRRKRANLTFSKAVPHLIPPVVAYLRSRGLAMPEHMERRWFRCFERYEWWMGANRETGECGPEFPVLISGMVNAQGLHCANHFTFLAPDGAGKAPVAKPKLMWPETTGLAIRVNKGETGLDPEAAAKAGKRGPLVVTEGIEDAITLALAAPHLRVWAAGSLPGYGSLPDHDCVSGFIVSKDNDWGKPAAAALFEQATARLKRFGKPVTVIAATVGKDFNDQWRAHD